MIGLAEALRLTLEAIRPLPVEHVALVDSIDRVASSNLHALVDSPSVHASRKEGYAVVSHEVADATAEKPVRLRLLGSVAAGDEKDIRMEPGATVRVLTGARIPTGAEAVVSAEFAKQEENEVLVETFAQPGRNILPRGGDVTAGECILRLGRQISPGTAGLLAAAGYTTVPVFRKPVIGIVGTGDEIIEPGKPLAAGKLYASNLITLAGWCDRYKMRTRMMVVKDDRKAIAGALEALSVETDALLTSGGAWMGDRDMMERVLDGLGWKKVFRWVRIGPGKAAGFGMLNNKPVFILPGGPSSNLMAFLQIALPGLLALFGHENPVLPRINARLASDLRGRESDWTDFFFGTLTLGEWPPTFYPSKKESHLSSIAEATAVASIPEGQDRLLEGSVIPVQLLNMRG